MHHGNLFVSYSCLELSLCLYYNRKNEFVNYQNCILCNSPKNHDSVEEIYRNCLNPFVHKYHNRKGEADDVPYQGKSVKYKKIYLFTALLWLITVIISYCIFLCLYDILIWIILNSISIYFCNKEIYESRGLKLENTGYRPRIRHSGLRRS